MQGAAGARKVAVLGTGSWGTTLAVVLARQGYNTFLLARDDQEARVLSTAGENSRFLPGFAFPSLLTPTADWAAALDGCPLLLMVVPSQSMRANIRRVAPLLGSDTLVMSASKGLEVGTSVRMSEVLAQELGAGAEGRLAALSGPNLSKEIASGRPSTTVVAAYDIEVAQRVQRMMNSDLFRVYTNPDIVGVELAGSLKNIIALAAGMADGLGAGDSAKAAIITRGLAEIARLGVAAGASLFTFAGLAGLGDLIATCASPLSRNRKTGEELARGRGLSEIQASLGGQVAEGVSTVAAARDLARRHGIELPITDQLYSIMFEHRPVMEGLSALLTREPTDELLSLGAP